MTRSVAETRRFAWFLYSDARMRLNTLLAEFRQVRLTAYAHMKQAAPDVLQLDKEQKNIHNYSSFGIREKQYYAIVLTATRELSHLLGVRDALSEAYVLAKEELVYRRDDSGSIGSSLYWFIAKRTHIVNGTVAYATRVLSHLHDKIAQMLDTTLGYTPHPLSLRRWQSANHEKFLSAYCEDQSADTARLMAFLNIPMFEPKSIDKKERATYEERSTKRWRQTVISHIWQHGHTSEELHFTSDGAALPSYALIRSVYFYLEHPILFPLLFHELAHIFMDLDRKERADSNDPDPITRSRYYSFLRSSEEAAHDLRQAAARQGYADIGDRVFEEITQEIWADAIGVALGGAAFVQALALQIFGQLEGINIVNFRGASEMDEPNKVPRQFWQRRLMPLDDGLMKQVPGDYFAIARVLTAASLAKRLYKYAEREPDRGPSPFKDDLEDTCDAIEYTWEELKRSGKNVYHSERASGRHEQWWEFYCSMNEWVVKACLLHLGPHIERMWRYVSDQHRYIYRLTEDDKLLRERVWGFYDSFLDSYGAPVHLKADPVPDYLKKLRQCAPTRLEDVALAVRWAMAKQLEPHTSDGDSGVTANKQKELDDFIDGTRWDGLGAFRYLLEWYHLVVSEFYRMTDEKHSSNVVRAKKEISNLKKFLKRRRAGTDANAAFRYLMQSFPLISLNPRYECWETYESKNNNLKDSLSWIGEELNYRLKFEELAQQLISVLKQELLSNGFDQIGKRDLPVSMLSLGVVRPSLASGQQTLWQSVNHLRDDLGRERKKKNSSEKWDASIFPAIGDYAYVKWQPEKIAGNFIDLGRDALTSEWQEGVSTPRHFEKPRMLLKVFGRKELLGLNKRGMPYFKEQEFLRLALVKFKHRSTWIEWLNKLRSIDIASEYCELYLSSGWEDAIIIIHHSELEELNPRELHDAQNNKHMMYVMLKELLDVCPEELDVQSMLLTNMPGNIELTGKYKQENHSLKNKLESLLDVVNEAQSILEYFKEQFHRESQAEVSAALTFGRYDGRLIWKKISPFDFQRLVMNFPASWYHKVQHLSHGLGWPLKMKGQENAEEKVYLFTRIDLSVH